MVILKIPFISFLKFSVVSRAFRKNSLSQHQIQATFIFAFFISFSYSCIFSSSQRCFIFRYLLVPHSFVVTYLSLAHTSIRADSPFGKTPQGERCENMLACFHIRTEDVSANSPQPVFFCVFPGSGVQGCCLSLCCANARAGSRGWSASQLRPCGNALRLNSPPCHAVSVPLKR